MWIKFILVSRFRAERIEDRKTDCLTESLFCGVLTVRRSPSFFLYTAPVPREKIDCRPGARPRSALLKLVR